MPAGTEHCLDTTYNQSRKEHQKEYYTYVDRELKKIKPIVEQVNSRGFDLNNDRDRGMLNDFYTKTLRFQAQLKVNLLTTADANDVTEGPADASLPSEPNTPADVNDVRAERIRKLLEDLGISSRVSPETLAKPDRTGKVVPSQADRVADANQVPAQPRAPPVAASDKLEIKSDGRYLHFYLNGQKWFAVGVNWRGRGYGWNFGNLVEEGFADYAELSEQLAAMKAYGIDKIRIHLLADARYLKEGFAVYKEDIQAFLDAAQGQKIKVQFVLFDYLAFTRNIFNIADVDNFITEFLNPFLEEFRSHPTLIAMDLINEPEWMLSNSVSGGYGDSKKQEARTNADLRKDYHPDFQPASEKDYFNFVAKVSSAIRSKTNSGVLVTIGTSFKHRATTTQFRVEKHLDYYSFHFYLWMNNDNKKNLSAKEEAYWLGYWASISPKDKPWVLGEYPTARTKRSAGQYLTQSFKAGATGADMWNYSPGIDDHTAKGAEHQKQLKSLQNAKGQLKPEDAAESKASLQDAPQPRRRLTLLSATSQIAGPNQPEDVNAPGAASDPTSLPALLTIIRDKVYPEYDQVLKGKVSDDKLEEIKSSMLMELASLFIDTETQTVDTKKLAAFNFAQNFPYFEQFFSELWHGRADAIDYSDEDQVEALAHWAWALSYQDYTAQGDVIQRDTPRNPGQLRAINKSRELNHIALAAFTKATGQTPKNYFNPNTAEGAKAAGDLLYWTLAKQTGLLSFRPFNQFKQALNNVANYAQILPYLQNKFPGYDALNAEEKYAIFFQETTRLTNLRLAQNFSDQGLQLFLTAVIDKPANWQAELISQFGDNAIWTVKALVSERQFISLKQDMFSALTDKLIAAFRLKLPEAAKTRLRAELTLANDIYGSLYNLENNLVETEIDALTLSVRQSLILARFRAWAVVSKEEIAGVEKITEQWLARLRELRGGILTYADRNGLTEILDELSPVESRTPVTNLKDIAGADIAIGAESQVVVEPAQRVIFIPLKQDLSNSRFTFLIKAKRLDGRTVKAVAIDTNSREAETEIKLEQSDLFHRMSFAPRANQEGFDPAQVKTIRIELPKEAQDIVLKNLRIEKVKATPAPEERAEIILELDKDQAIGGFEFLREGNNLDQGLLYFDLTTIEDLPKNGENADLSHKDLRVTLKLPAPYDKSGIQALVSIVDAQGGLLGKWTTSIVDGNLNTILGMLPVGDFDPSQSILLEVKYNFSQQAPKITVGFGLLGALAAVAFVISLGWFFTKYSQDQQGKGTIRKLYSFIRFFNKGKAKPKAHKKKEEVVKKSLAALMDSAQPANNLSDDEMLNVLGAATMGIDRWVDAIGVDFRYTGGQQEEKGIFFPWLRKSEAWEFFDQRAVPRYNLNIIKQAIVFAIAATVLYFGINIPGLSLTAYPGLIHLYPYAALAMIFGFLNWIKVARSATLAAAFLSAQHYLPQALGISLAQVSLSLTVLTLSAYVAGLFFSYYRAIAKPDQYIKQQLEQLKKLHAVLAFLKNGDQGLALVLSAIDLDQIEDANELFDQVLSYQISAEAAGFINVIKGEVGYQYKNKGAAQKKEYLRQVKDFLFELGNHRFYAMISGLSRFKRSRNVDAWLRKPYEGGAVVKTAPFETILDQAVQETEGLLAKKPQFSITRVKASRLVAALALAGLAGWAFVKIAPKAWLGASGLIIAIPAITIITLGIFAISVGRKAEQLALIYPAKDMKNIYRDYQRLIYSTTTKENLRAIDVRRFLVETRAALNREMQAKQDVTTADLQGSLDAQEEDMINVRDTTTARDFMDTFHLTKLEHWGPKLWMLARVAYRVLYFAAIAYVGSILAIVAAREIASLIAGSGFLNLTQMFENPFAIVKIGEILFKGPMYYSEIWAWLPKLGIQAALGMTMLGSLTLFTLKFAFYFLGKHAKVYEGDKTVSLRHFIWHGSFGAAALTFLVAMNKLSVVISPPWLDLTVRLTLIALVLYSLFKLILLNVAKNRFKAIVVNDRLYDGSDPAQRRASYNLFVDTVLGKYTQRGLDLILAANNAKRDHPANDCSNPDYWKNHLSHREVMRYQGLMGKGAEPSGVSYNSATQQAIEAAYQNLTKEQILQRMSSAGFTELRSYLSSKGAAIADDVSLWGSHDDPSRLHVTADQLREFLETSANERKIIIMYDFLPKFTPWIVVVGGAQAVFKLINSLLALRYPLAKLRFIFAGENWDAEVQDEVRNSQRSGKYPREQLIYKGMVMREDGRLGEPAQPYTKPGANTAVLRYSDGVAGVIYDAENLPNPNQPLQLLLGTMAGISNLRHLIKARLTPALNANWRRIIDRDNTNQVIAKTRKSVKTTLATYMGVLKSKQGRADMNRHYQFNFKRGAVLRRHLLYFVNHALRRLLELAAENPRNLSPGEIWKLIDNTIGDNSKSGRRQRRELNSLHITLANMPGYGELATEYAKGNVTRDDFIRQLVIGEYKRINEPRNGQGRLAKVNTALHRSKGQVAAYMYGEYASWYTAGWDGFMAAQDTFKPLGGTTGYFCTETPEELDWTDPELAKSGLDTNFVARHYQNKNKLLTLGAWDEYQVAEDYMLGFVSWFYGFNIAAFYSLTPEDPAGFESGLSFKFRPKQMSRWIKGYIIGLLVICEGNMRELKERKGWWGVLVFFVPTLCSAIHPITFRIARIVTVLWWNYFVPLAAIALAVLSSPLALHAVWLNNLTGIGTLIMNFQAAVSIVIPQALPFLPTGWAWGIGPAIVIVPVFLHRYFTMRGIFKGVDDYLCRQRILEEYDEWIEDLEGKLQGAENPVVKSALAELCQRRQVIATGSLEEIPGVVSPRRFMFGIGLLMGGFIAMVIANGAWNPGGFKTASLAIILAAVAYLWARRFITSGPRRYPSLRFSLLRKVLATSVLTGAALLANQQPIVASWIVVTAAVTMTIYILGMGSGRFYIALAGRDTVERSVRVNRFRTALPNFFIDFYHMLYLSGNEIAWLETIDGGRIGYWWRTPRPVGITNEAIDRYKSKELNADEERVYLNKLFKSFTSSKDIETQLEEPRLTLQLYLNYGFMVVMFLLVGLGLRSDVRDYLLGEAIVTAINGTSYLQVAASGITRLAVTAAIIFTLWIVVRLNRMLKVRVAMAKFPKTPGHTPASLPLTQGVQQGQVQQPTITIKDTKSKARPHDREDTKTKDAESANSFVLLPVGMALAAVELLSAKNIIIAIIGIIVIVVIGFTAKGFVLTFKAIRSSPESLGYQLDKLDTSLKSLANVYSRISAILDIEPNWSDKHVVEETDKIQQVISNIAGNYEWWQNEITTLRSRAGALKVASDPTSRLPILRDIAKHQSQVVYQIKRQFIMISCIILLLKKELSGRLRVAEEQITPDYLLSTWENIKSDETTKQFAQGYLYFIGLTEQKDFSQMLQMAWVVPLVSLSLNWTWLAIGAVTLALAAAGYFAIRHSLRINRHNQPIVESMTEEHVSQIKAEYQELVDRVEENTAEQARLARRRDLLSQAISRMKKTIKLIMKLRHQLEQGVDLESAYQRLPKKLQRVASELNYAELEELLRDDDALDALKRKIQRTSLKLKARIEQLEQVQAQASVQDQLTYTVIQRYTEWFTEQLIANQGKKPDQVA
ncbi:hypothetical protein ACFL1I_07925, partial [Candidatus Omnitrophota bacterium]